ncbi:MAG: hypothetical protein V8Q91_07980 [Bilophila wadsworthia]
MGRIPHCRIQKSGIPWRPQAPVQNVQCAGNGRILVVDVVVFRKHGALLPNERPDQNTFRGIESNQSRLGALCEGGLLEGRNKTVHHGEVHPQSSRDRWSREEVQGEIDSTAIKQKGGLKISISLPLEALSLVEPITRNYGEGDKRIINGEPHTMIAGEWIKDAIDSTPTAIDPKKYGAESLEQLEGILSG